MVNRFGHQFFTGSVFTLDQDGGIRRCHVLQDVDDAIHLRTVADHAFEAETFFQVAPQFRVAANQSQPCRCFFDSGPKLADVQWLSQVRVRAVLHGSDS